MYCKDCGKTINRGNRSSRCEDCQLRIRLKRENERQRLRHRWLTRLGGKPITLREIRTMKRTNRKHLSAWDGRRNEAEWRKDIVKNFEIEDEPVEKPKKRTLKEIYEDWKYEDN